MTDDLLSRSYASSAPGATPAKGPLAEVEPSELQAISGGFEFNPPPLPKPGPVEDWCGTKPRPFPVPLPLPRY
jgi:hypothetical protein